MAGTLTKWGGKCHKEGGIIRTHPEPWQRDGTDPRLVGVRHGDVMRFRGVPWLGNANDDGDPAQHYGGQGGIQPDGTPFMRPQPWKEEDEGEPSPSNPACIYSFHITLRSGDNNSQTVYLQEGANPVCFYNNPVQGNLTYTGANPPICAVPTPNIQGDYTIVVPISFEAWWNFFQDCWSPAPEPPLSSLLQIDNTGTCDLDVNGTNVPPGGVFQDFAVAFAGFNTGDQSGFLGGSVYTITPV